MLPSHGEDRGIMTLPYTVAKFQLEGLVEFWRERATQSFTSLEVCDNNPMTHSANTRHLSNLGLQCGSKSSHLLRIKHTRLFERAKKRVKIGTRT